MNIQDFIRVRRDKGKHTEAELREFCQLAARAEIPDYQISAWLMAAFLEPLSLDETVWLTKAMADSGERLDLSGLKRPWLDKHSTGGVGDKTTMVVLPVLAACGLTMVKMSGRGLGITGGTVDKLESIPGFRMDLSPTELVSQAGQIGIAITGQTAKLAPADGAFYALRDSVSAVENIPLIASSILSKKLAGGAEVVSIDVKCGSGGFMTGFESARQLGEMLREVGERCGLKVLIEITDMSQALGRTVGNSIEVREAIRVLQGEPGRLRDLCLILSGRALGAIGRDPDEARQALDSGQALEKAKAWVGAQGGDVRIFEDEALLALAPETLTLDAPVSGYLSRLDAGALGRAVVALGGGREQKGDAIDPSVGIEVFAEVGDHVMVGRPLLKVYARTNHEAYQALLSLRPAVGVSQTPVSPPPLILAAI
jgi:pyrimidine-nucleoside phosphorylase